MKIDVKIIATPEVMKLASTALAVQDACNPLPVTNLLLEVQMLFRNKNGQCENYGTDMSIQNPISKIVLDKLCSLARCYNGIASGNDFQICERLVNGFDCTYEIDTIA